MTRSTTAFLTLTLFLTATALASAADTSDGEKKKRRFLSKLREPDTFIQSGDYRDGEEIIHGCLEDEDYAKMVEDIERHDVDFDWGWAKSIGDKPKKPELAFRIADYQTIRVLPVPNKALKVAPDIEEATHQALAQAMQLLGLDVVDGEADLELEAAVVDYKSDSTYIFVATVNPFFEIEGRLRDLATGETLFLFRHQEHGTTAESAAADFAGDLAKFLR